jgi:hypothetical protein
VRDLLAEVRRTGRAVRDRHVPDPRVEVFQLRTAAPRPGGGVRIRVESTLPEAAQELARLLEAAGIAADIDVTLLPDPALEPRGEALVTAGVASAYRRPTMRSTLLTQYPMGARLTLLNRRGRFWRVRGEDGHVGWIHTGAVVRGKLEWALAWERAEGGEPVVSLGASLRDEADQVFARLPWGSRVLQASPGRILLPDGRAGMVAEGEVVPAGRLWDRFPPRGESVTRTARRWIGASYLWGGVTPLGVDCSGFVQSVYWLHGVALPRDSDMQIRVGATVEPRRDWSGLVAGDLLFFAEQGRVRHVALSLGGSRIIHASASNGGVALDDLAGDGATERALRTGFAGARRLLPD